MLCNCNLIQLRTKCQCFIQSWKQSHTKYRSKEYYFFFILTRPLSITLLLVGALNSASFPLLPRLVQLQQNSSCTDVKEVNFCVYSDRSYPKQRNPLSLRKDSRDKGFGCSSKIVRGRPLKIVRPLSPLIFLLAGL